MYGTDSRPEPTTPIATLYATLATQMLPQFAKEARTQHHHKGLSFTLQLHGSYLKRNEQTPRTSHTHLHIVVVHHVPSKLDYWFGVLQTQADGNWEFIENVPVGKWQCIGTLSSQMAEFLADQVHAHAVEFQKRLRLKTKLPTVECEFGAYDLPEVFCPAYATLSFETEGEGDHAVSVPSILEVSRSHHAIIANAA